MVSFSKADIHSGWNGQKSSYLNMTANFTDIKIENELQRMEWTNHSRDINEVLEDVDGALA